MVHVLLSPRSCRPLALLQPEAQVQHHSCHTGKALLELKMQMEHHCSKERIGSPILTLLLVLSPYLRL